MPLTTVFIQSGFHGCVRVSVKSLNDHTEGSLVPARAWRIALFHFFFVRTSPKNGIGYSLSQLSYKFFLLKQSLFGSLFFSPFN